MVFSENRNFLQSASGVLSSGKIEGHVAPVVSGRVPSSPDYRPVISFRKGQRGMKRTKWIKEAIVLGLAAVAMPSSAWGMMIAPQPLSQRTVTAECIVVGKVTGFGDKTVSAERFPGDKEKGQYQIAVVKVETNLHGADGAKEIKVGFLPPPAPQGGPRGGIRPFIRRPVAPSLALNQEGLMFLVKHHNADFYIAPMYFSIVNKQGNANFDKDVNEVKHCLQLLADPKAGLGSKEESDRILTAGMLMARYRQVRQGAGQPKLKPIAPALSKKILQILADANWNARPPRPGPFQMTPQLIFSQLQLTEQDGWTPPKDFKQLPERAKEWCKENADKYVIKRYQFPTDDEHEKKSAR
jgi:hypothetical protein